MSQELVAKGHRCIIAARRVYDLDVYTESEANDAKNSLAALKEDGEQLQKAAKEAKEDFMEQGRKLKNEMAQLEAEEQSFESTVSSLTSSKSAAEYQLQNQERALSETRSQQSQAENRLRSAESDLRSAKKKEKDVAVASVAGGIVVGLLTFGVGGLAVGALAGGATAAIINNCEGKVRDARRDISRCHSDVESSERSVRSTRDRVSNIGSEISDYQRRIQHNKQEAIKRHEKVSRVMKSIDFSEKSIDFWEDFTTVSKSATERSERLERLVNKAIKKENYRIMRANGTVTIAQSFVEAWEEVSKKGQIMPA